jgi:hypothetical protein
MLPTPSGYQRQGAAPSQPRAPQVGDQLWAINSDGNEAAVSNEYGKRISGKGMGFPFRSHSLAPNSLAHPFSFVAIPGMR